MKKVIAFLLCLMLVLSLAAPVLAAEETSTITFLGSAPGAKYAAYRILFASNVGDAYGYDFNSKYEAALKELMNETDINEIRSDIIAMSSSELMQFANDLYLKIKDTHDPDYTNWEVNDSGETVVHDSMTVAQGYYLIVETDLGDYGEGYGDDVFSLHMLDTVGDDDIEISTKEKVPTVKKDVYEVNDSVDLSAGTDSAGNHASYDIGDTITFEVTGSISAGYEGYETYYYSFTDTMDPGLTLNKDSIKFYVGAAGSLEIENAFEIEFDDANNSFTATANLKEITSPTITHNSTITMTYTAVLNENAVSGTDGNKNSVVLNYQNNPYTSDEGHYGTTPPDVTVVYTFDTVVNKVDANGAPLSGAIFELQKYNKETQMFETFRVIENPEDGSVFRFRGLDEGIYKLVEIKAPDSYNKANDIEFHIHPKYDTSVEPARLIGLEVENAAREVISKPATEVLPEGETRNGASFTVTLNETTGEVATNVVNRQGTELPSTGGMGTTLIYIAGGILVLAAVVLLITKKRMSDAA